MKVSRIIYAILVILAIVAYGMPWMITDGQSFPGWAMILPFTFGYFIGLILAVVILFTGYKAVGLSIFAGILMVISILISGVIIGLGAGLSSFSHSGSDMPMGNGFELAAITSMVFVVLGPIMGNQFRKHGNKVIIVETE